MTYCNYQYLRQSFRCPISPLYTDSGPSDPSDKHTEILLVNILGKMAYSYIFNANRISLNNSVSDTECHIYIVHTCSQLIGVNRWVRPALVLVVLSWLRHIVLLSSLDLLVLQALTRHFIPNLPLKSNYDYNFHTKNSECIAQCKRFLNKS